MNRDKNYRREVKYLHFLKRKKLINGGIRNWNLTDEQIKVTMEAPVNWMSNEWWYVNKKRQYARRTRHSIKNELKNYERN